MADYDASTPSESSDESTPGEPITELSGAPAEEYISAAKIEDSESSQSPEETQDSATMSTRAYQQEMLEESLKRNIIIAVRGDESR